MSTRATGKKSTRPRTASPAVRRAQLIQATMRSIARRGIAGTTLADVAREAGLSQGIINLHFQSKEKLLIETLRCLADEYKAAWEAALAAAGPTPAERLAVLMRLDFTAAVCERQKLAVWFAFWGEAQARPTYRRLCATRDRAYGTVLLELCERIVAEGNYRDLDPRMVAKTLSAMSDGLWLALLLTPRQLDRAGARETCFRYLAGVFPRHFNSNPPES